MFNEFSEGDGGATPDLTEPSKEALAYLLRHKEKWPEGFDFLFIVPCRCAMGLAQRTWPEKIAHPSSERVGIALGLNSYTSHHIFNGGRGPNSSPEEIAELLEAI